MKHRRNPLKPRTHLENQVKELEQKLQVAGAKLLEKVGLYLPQSMIFLFFKLKKKIN
jgi:hypothetical protein